MNTPPRPRRRFTPARGPQLLLATAADRRGASASHSNLGKIFEGMIAASNGRYTSERSGYIVRHPNAWAHTSPQVAAAQPACNRAVTGAGRTIIRTRSPWDFSGVYRGRAVAFDAKEFEGPSIKIRNLKQHQAEHLHHFHRAGGLGGFLLYSWRAETVFWIPAPAALEAVDASRLRGALQSLNLAWLAEHALELCQAKPGQAPPYAEALIEKLGGSMP